MSINADRGFPIGPDDVQDAGLDVPANAWTGRRIAAPTSLAWVTLTDLGSWINWNPDVTGMDVDGDLEPGLRRSKRFMLAFIEDPQGGPLPIHTTAPLRARQSSLGVEKPTGQGGHRILPRFLTNPTKPLFRSRFFGRIGRPV